MIEEHEKEINNKVEPDGAAKEQVKDMEAPGNEEVAPSSEEQAQTQSLRNLIANPTDIELNQIPQPDSDKVAV